MKNIVISGSGVFTPADSISNEELVASFNQYVDNFNQQHAAEIERGELEALGHSSCEFIEKASGIKSRHVLYKEGILDPAVMHPVFPRRGEDQAPEMVEMALIAAKEAMAEAGKTASDIDLIICAASNMQRPYPALSVELQQQLGVTGYAFDMNVACSSATFAISNAANAIRGGTAKVVLVVNPEFASPQVNYRSRDSHFIFGDVCTATIIEAEDTCSSPLAFRILGMRLKTEFSNNIRCDIGYTEHCFASPEPEIAFFRQQGRKVFKELLPLVADVIATEMAAQQVTPEQLKRLWLHQANINMNIFAAKKILGRDPLPEEAPLVLDRYANTASAGSIIAFHQHKTGLQAGDKAILCSFGAGYSIGCLVLEQLAAAGA
ncbi:MULTISPECIES: beta-ketoacyl-ACP synthase III [Alkalimonas]|uniref:Beta-ketoacyl-ACP synthase III n=1 Tax=Alkalimonas mucilaginosa TaxID=3057676 RepID=A0ABU7JJ69_9GAMM|nr:beta-ketoacyl-ACP synthase III [Alkalimonas sp. MEB004]MEE2025738.1 beta-ketoacyl-ACP synthase III [Alkalimonas sp. MEB004]